MMSQARIVITSATEFDAKPYRRALESRGANVCLAIPNEMAKPRDPLMGATGLMLSGGADVDPVLYGETPDSTAGLITNRSLDDLEIELLGCALNLDYPIFAICRGMQILNVVFGGKLIQDIPNHKATLSGNHTSSAVHQIYLSPGSKLAAIIGSGGIMRVNSRHHQGLREAHKSPRLLASAYSLGDGLIEGLESPAHDWVLGLQCHPELEDEVPSSFGRIFQAFIERAEMAASRR